ncbi:MAG TPA: hypothetical protein PLS50_07135 [Candidatus Dojkabacteria bacterium]|nr:hypothetical protein [Candidatus Dojkabacteria bacterium]
MQHKDKLKGSVLSNMDVYKYSWFHCDDFCNFENKYMFDDGSFSMIAGAPLTNISTNWTFNGVRIKNQSFNHYTYCIVTKMMKLTATGLEVST